MTTMFIYRTYGCQGIGWYILVNTEVHGWIYNHNIHNHCVCVFVTVVYVGIATWYAKYNLKLTIHTYNQEASHKSMRLFVPYKLHGGTPQLVP